MQEHSHNKQIVSFNVFRSNFTVNGAGVLGLDPICIYIITIDKDLVGGFNPSEEYESQLGWWHSQYMEK